MSWTKEELSGADLGDRQRTRGTLGKNRVYLPTTVAQGCFLGVSLTESAATDALTQGYREFQGEAALLNPDYAPITVNTVMLGKERNGLGATCSPL